MNKSSRKYFLEKDYFAALKYLILRRYSKKKS